MAREFIGEFPRERQALFIPKHDREIAGAQLSDALIQRVFAEVH